MQVDAKLKNYSIMAGITKNSILVALPVEVTRHVEIKTLSPDAILPYMFLKKWLLSTYDLDEY